MCERERLWEPLLYADLAIATVAITVLWPGRAREMVIKKCLSSVQHQLEVRDRVVEGQKSTHAACMMGFGTGLTVVREKMKRGKKKMERDAIRERETSRMSRMNKPQTSHAAAAAIDFIPLFR